MENQFFLLWAMYLSVGLAIGISLYWGYNYFKKRTFFPFSKAVMIIFSLLYMAKSTYFIGTVVQPPLWMAIGYILFLAVFLYVILNILFPQLRGKMENINKSKEY